MGCACDFWRRGQRVLTGASSLLPVPTQPLAKGPLVVHWHRCELEPLRAGALATALVEVENAGTATWRSAGEEGIRLSYHWLDDRGNPIVWDGIRSSFERPVEPGEVVRVGIRVRAVMPPGIYGLALDLVDEGRLWLSELGNEPLVARCEVAPRIARRLAARGGDAAALAAQDEALVPEAEAEAIAHLPPGAAPAPDWSRRLLDTHQEGFAVVGGAVEPARRLFRRAPAELEPYRPGSGRIPQFPHPLVCPSIAHGVAVDWSDPVAGLPAAHAPRDEPWIHDGRIVVATSLARTSRWRSRRRAGGNG
jgi:hypothetical protein